MPAATLQIVAGSYSSNGLMVTKTLSGRPKRSGPPPSIRQAVQVAVFLKEKGGRAGLFDF